MPSPILALDPLHVRQLAKAWLLEDSTGLDYASLAAGSKMSQCEIICKQPCILAGKPFVDAVFEAVGCSVEWMKDDGQAAGDEVVAVVSGRASDVFRAERVALNCLARTCGVATVADRVVMATRRAHWQGRVCGTRKTTPGFRLAEKYSLLVGGADTHRYDRSSMVMLKDNHIWASGSITEAIGKCKAACGLSLKLEVEVRCATEAIEAGNAGCDIIMLDNFTPEDARITATLLKKSFPNTMIEASGGITESTVKDYLYPAIDYVSMSCLTQGYATIDFSMKLRHNPTV